MTIKAYLDKLDKAGGQPLTDSMMAAAEVWSNNACMGYFIEAARMAELDQATIRKVLEAFGTVFDETAVDEAERTYYDY